MTMQRKILTFMLATLFALSAFAASAEAYYYDSGRSYERFDRTYEYNVDEKSDYDYDYGCRYCTGTSRSNSYSRSERFKESIRHDTYERSPRYSYYSPYYGHSYYRHNDYSPRSRYHYPSSFRSHYDPFGYYRARPHRQYVY